MSASRIQALSNSSTTASVTKTFPVSSGTKHRTIESVISQQLDSKVFPTVKAASGISEFGTPKETQEVEKLNTLIVLLQSVFFRF